MPDFEGNTRFEVVARLGRGGMGSVYQVVDREHASRVALKTVGNVDGDALLRFKQEFRALKAVHHPNIVELGELHEERGEWFFTMELVEGVDFLSFVRGAKVAHEASEARRLGEHISSAPTLPSLANTDVDLLGRDGPPRAVSGAYDEARLRRTLGQLAIAIATLHRHGRVHRDLKSSNVLVTPDGRVVVIDFGLVAALEQPALSMELQVVGTVAYMAPEQATGTPAGPAADWYSLGVMLFEALTGALPFAGPALEVLIRKQTMPPPTPRSLVPTIPEDLDRLCTELLSLEPARRPQEAEILARLAPPGDGGKHERDARRSELVRAPGVERARELLRLESAFVRATRGTKTAIAIVGPAGSGRTALVERFLAELRATTPNAVLLIGRCDDREHVPFKALDGVVDQLSRSLRRFERAEVDAILPADTGLLARTFPVLTRVESVAQRVAAHVDDPDERRVRVRFALLALVANVAQRRPTVLAIDDLDASDAESLTLLGDLVHGDDAPCLFVFTTSERPHPELERVLASCETIALSSLPEE